MYIFKVHICFPGYIQEIDRVNQESASNDSPRRKPNQLAQGDVKFFTDKVLLPALRDAHYAQQNPQFHHLVQNFPLSHGTAAESCRGRNGQTSVLKKKVEHAVLAGLVHHMDSRIALLSPSRRVLYESYFFFSVAHGLKKMVAAYSQEDTDAEEVIKSLFPDVLWPDDLGDVFLDIAAVFVADTPGCPTTGLWLKSSTQDRIPHRGVIQQFFGSSLRLGNYTLNPFGHFKSVAGFKYVASNVNGGDGALGVRKLQAYHTMKTQFEYRGSSWRHNLGTSVQPSDVWKNSKRFKQVAVSFSFITLYLHSNGFHLSIY
jgi:hypothetical protein